MGDDPIDSQMTTAHESPIDILERWELFGAQWRVVQLSDEHAVVDLCTCTGEPVERLKSADPALIDYLRSAKGDLVLTEEEEDAVDTRDVDPASDRT